MRLKPLVPIFSLLLSSAVPSVVLAATGSGSGGGVGSSSSASTPSSGAVTVGTGAGQLEGDLLAAREINHAANRICHAVTHADTGSATQRSIVIVPGTDRPDISDWLVFQRRLDLIASEYTDTETDFLTRDTQLAKVKLVKKTLKSERGSEANGETIEKAIGSVLQGLGPTGAVMTGFEGLATIAAGLSSTYDFGGNQVTFSDYSLAMAVAGYLPDSYDAVIPAHLDFGAAAMAIQDAITPVERAQTSIRAKKYVDRANADLKRITTLLPTANATHKAQLNAISAAITVDVANFAQADTDLHTLKVSLIQPAAGAAPTPTPASTDATSTSTKSTTAKADASTLATSTTAASPTLLAVLLREKTLADRLSGSDARVLYVKIELSSGGYFTKQNLLTFFGANPLHVAGGSVVDYAYYVGPKRKTSGFVPLDSGYKNIGEIKSDPDPDETLAAAAVTGCPAFVSASKSAK